MHAVFERRPDVEHVFQSAAIEDEIELFLPDHTTEGHQIPQVRNGRKETCDRNVHASNSKRLEIRPVSSLIADDGDLRLWNGLQRSHNSLAEKHY